MIEIHTGIQCSCGKNFYALLTTDTPLAQGIEGHVECPECGKEHIYKYEYSAKFPCLPASPLARFFNWLRPKAHYIAEHFTKTESPGVEVFPRRCLCGTEILLTQRRIL